jgi:hypothetical protein
VTEFLRDTDASPTHNPQPGGPGCLFGTSLGTCISLVALPAARLPPSKLSSLIIYD